MTSDPVVRFYRLISQARPPQRADRSAAGTLPTRASRYCDAVTAAAGFGWWLFPPMDFSLLWDGEQVFWTWDETEHWLPLDAAQFPRLRRSFDAAAPEALRGCAPPFLTALPEPGTVQIWSGLFARTQPGWSLLLRPPANLFLTSGFACYEGIVETDRWFGPLFINIRLTRTNSAIRLHADRPLLQAQPLPRAAYGEATLGAMTTQDELAPADWADYARHVAMPAADRERPFGAYAVEARRRRRCPVAG